MLSVHGMYCPTAQGEGMAPRFPGRLGAEPPVGGPPPARAPRAAAEGSVPAVSDASSAGR